MRKRPCTMRDWLVTFGKAHAPMQFILGTGVVSQIHHQQSHEACNLSQRECDLSSRREESDRSSCHRHIAIFHEGDRAIYIHHASTRTHAMVLFVLGFDVILDSYPYAGLESSPSQRAVTMDARSECHHRSSMRWRILTGIRRRLRALHPG
jgi:hypothetical protein